VDDIPVQACPTHAPSFTTTIQKKQIFVETDKYASYNPEGETKRLCASVQVPEHDRGQTRLNTKPVCHHLECKKLRYVFSFRRHHSLCTDHFFSQGMFKPNQNRSRPKLVNRLRHWLYIWISWSTRFAFTHRLKNQIKQSTKMSQMHKFRNAWPLQHKTMSRASTTADETMVDLFRSNVCVL
jgi:hypothetical protein